jgi:hypothetical protein
MEHRWGRRVPIDAPVRLVLSRGAVGYGQLRDVSITGAFVQTHFLLPLLSLVDVEPQLVLPGDRRMQRLPACVVRKDSTGVGLEWTEPAAHVLERILRPRAALPFDGHAPTYFSEPTARYVVSRSP